jgi:hypothetical protein
LKDPNGNWDIRPHAGRIIVVNDETLETWRALLENPEVPARHTRMVYAVNRSTASVLAKLSHSQRMGALGLQFSPGWHEKNDRVRGYFESDWGRPNSWNDVILQGPHIFVATPMYKFPNRTMLHNQDWSSIDLESIEADFIPITAYKPKGDRSKYELDYTTWNDRGRARGARSYYRIAWRRMTANTGERTFISALIPPGAAHMQAVYSMAFPDAGAVKLALLSGFTSSLVLDFCVRSVPKADIVLGTINRLPANLTHPLAELVIFRTLRLNCVTSAYLDLWSDCYSPSFRDDAWAGGFDHARRLPLGRVGQDWNFDTPLRVAADRRQATVEIDALVALMLGLAAEELCTIYRTQFAVLYGYDRSVYYYDVNGRLVPNSVLSAWRKKADRITQEERTATNQAGNTYTYELPFVTLDREADMRQAYAHFERLLKERS